MDTFSSINLDVKLSPKVLPLQASSKLDPVNLEDNFKAATEAVPGEDKIFDSPPSSESSGKLTSYQVAIRSIPPPNAIFQKYTYAVAWKQNHWYNIFKSLNSVARIFLTMTYWLLNFIAQGVLSQN